MIEKSIGGTIGSKQDTDLLRRGGLMSSSPTNMLLPFNFRSPPPSSFFFELVLKQEKYEVLKAALVSKNFEVDRPELFK